MIKYKVWVPLIVSTVAFVGVFAAVKCLYRPIVEWQNFTLIGLLSTALTCVIGVYLFSDYAFFRYIHFDRFKKIANARIVSEITFRGDDALFTVQKHKKLIEEINLL